jgi:hypothetical protein
MELSRLTTTSSPAARRDTADTRLLANALETTITTSAKKTAPTGHQVAHRTTTACRDADSTVAGTPMGHELMLRITDDAYTAILTRHHILRTCGITPAELTDPDTRDELMEDITHTLNDTVHDQLLAAHLHLIRTHFDPTAGRRAFGELEITYLHDPVELGHDETIIGISLSSRYRPILTDWAHEYGGSDAPITFDTTTVALIDAARTELARILPEFADATIAVIPRWY